MARRDQVSLRNVKTLLEVGAVGDLTDGQLLERFKNRGGEVGELAFTALVDRHGPMVLHTCMSILGNDHDSQDAFQATFLVLVRRSDSLWVQNSLGPWLHEVARCTAYQARSGMARRREHERRTAEKRAHFDSDQVQDDLAETIHEEVGRLPSSFRAAVVLCLLEGLSPERAASQLGWPVGTVHSRLARARERLRGRLTKRGFTPSVLFLPTLSTRAMVLPNGLSEHTARAASWVMSRHVVEVGLVSSSTVAIVVGVSRTMLISKLLKGTAALVAVIAVSFSTVGFGQLLTGQPDGSPSADPPKSRKAETASSKPKDKEERLRRERKTKDFADRLEELARRARQQLENGNTEDVLACLADIEFVTEGLGNSLTQGKWDLYTGKVSFTGEVRRSGDRPPPPPTLPLPPKPATPPAR